MFLRKMLLYFQDRRRQVCLKHCHISAEVQDVTSQKTIITILTVIRISNLTKQHLHTRTILLI
jgi:hypothetical protein